MTKSVEMVRHAFRVVAFGTRRRSEAKAGGAPPISPAPRRSTRVRSALAVNGFQESVSLHNGTAPTAPKDAGTGGRHKPISATERKPGQLRGRLHQDGSHMTPAPLRRSVALGPSSARSSSPRTSTLAP
jgi:hypothetical protein